MARTLNGVDTESEIGRVEAHLRESGWAEHASLEREMLTWTRLAHEVSDYAMTVDDYTNDLCSRDYLADALSSATDAWRVVISARIAPPDDLFRASTVDDVEGRLGRHFQITAQDGWWWHRRPSSGPLAILLSD